MKEVEGARDILEQRVRERTAELRHANERLVFEIGERRRIEEALRESEEKFRSLVETSPDWIWETDASGCYSYASPGVRKLLGYDPEEVIGRKAFEFMPPEEADRITAEFERISAERRPFYNLQNINLHKDGRKVVLETSGVPRLDHQRNLIGYRGIDRDITERKLTERIMQIRLDLMQYAATHSLEELLQRTLDEVESCTDSQVSFYHFVGADQKTIMLQAWSSRTVRDFCRAEGKGLHYSIDEAGVWVDCIGERGPVVHNDYASLPHRKGLPPGHAPVQRELVVPIMRHDRVVAILGVGNKSQDYTERDIEITTYLADVAWEIAERKLSEERITRINTTLLALTDDSEWNIRMLIELCGKLLNADCSLYSRVDNNLLCVKAEWRAPPDLRKEDSPEGHLCFDVIRDNSYSPMVIRNLQETDYARTDPKVAAYGLHTYVGYPVRCGGVNRGSLCVVYSCDIRPTEDDLRILGIIAAAVGQEENRWRGEEERLKLERQLLQAQRLESLGVLSGGIAHDFNNLLMGIIGGLELALLKLPVDSPACSTLNIALGAAQRGTNLTGQMLAYSGRGHFATRQVDLTELVQESMELFRSTLPKTITLNLDLRCEDAGIEADPGQLQQVILNLITNGAEAIGEQPGVITLSTGIQEYDEAELRGKRINAPPHPGRFVYVEVSDTGCGMDEQTQQRLFDPFFSTKFPGRGLGMSVVLGIVRGHKGAIFVTSEVAMKTTVRILFPSTEPVTVPTREPSAESLPIPEPDKPRRAILLVDDEEMLRQVCSEFLDELGFHTITAADGQEGVGVFKEHAEEFACVLLDLSMPRMDGYSAFQEMRRLRPDIPVILCSGFLEEDVKRRFAKEGLAGFIHKPYRLAMLQETIEAALNGSTGKNT